MQAHCVFGPPGCGKTQYLIATANREIKKVSRVLFLSFTKAAAAEAASRIEDSDRIVPSTIHAYAYRTLGLTRQQVVNENTMAGFSGEIGVPVRGPGEDALQIGDEYIDVISFARNRKIELDDAYERYGRPGTPREFFMFAEGYANWKRTYGYMDFDDMLENLLLEKEVTVPPVLILDEAQDCSPLQWAVIHHLSRFTRRMYIAGDDDQAIYEWSGADPHGMATFAISTDAKIDVLNQSYRMPWSVHDFVHTFILREMIRRHKKEYKGRVGGSDYGVVRYNTTNDLPIHEIGKQESLVLVRDRFRMLDMKKQLNASLVPYRVAGSSSPYDNMKAHAIRGMVKANRGDPVTEQELSALSIVLQDSPTKKGDLSRVMGKQWQKDIPLTETQLEFYSSIDLFAPINTTLSTIHQAKGREADRVYVDLELTPRVIEDLYRNRDAELRVMYVACTRAREGLVLCGENPLL